MSETAFRGIDGTVDKAILSIRDRDLGQVLAHSSMSDVYLLDSGHVLKLHHPTTRIGEIRRQVSITDMLFRAGLPAPRTSTRLVRNIDNGRYGVVCDRVQGRSVSWIRSRHPWRPRWLARRFASEHLRIHSCAPISVLPSLPERVAFRLRGSKLITEQQRRELLTILDRVQHCNRVCHGDYHLSNVMLADDGSATVLDWGDAVNGSPAWDVARSLVLLYCNSMKRILIGRILYRDFARLYLREYLAQAPIEPGELRDFYLLNVAQRLDETSIGPERCWLRDYLRRRL